MTSPNFAPDAPKSSSTPLETIDALVVKLRQNKDRWVRTTNERRAELLERCIDRTKSVAEEWVAAACKAKGLDPRAPQAGEEWLGGPMCVVRNLRMFAEAVRADGQPPLPATHRRPDGQMVAEIFPANLIDKLTFTGFSAEVWIEPGKELTQGRIYREKARGKLGDGKVALVLGAGNVASIGPMDALYKLFVEDEVVIVKTNPVNAYLLPFWEEAFRPLVDEGVLAVVRGGADVGKHLVNHPDVDTIHITGSDRTHDAIVWGGDPDEQARRKASGEKVLTKPISSELGAVTPVFVVPGPWEKDDIEFQARNVVGMVANNASFNCNAAKILVTARGWPEREKFLERVEYHLERAAPRQAYYPGAQQRYDGFLEHYSQSKPLGPRSKAVVPWTIIEDVPAKKGEYALTNEAFCGVLAETRLDASNPGDFLRLATELGNDVCWGTLSCVILIHPATEKQYAKQLDAALAGLRYGGIAVNCFAGVIYALVSPTWGAFPGHTDEDIQSGRGVVHNGYMIDHPQKSIVRAPFRINPTPVWFADHRTAQDVGRQMVQMEANPTLLRLPPLAIAALRG
ncbi:MAG: aldehyde dehydrogenase family protein [Sandaracinaceae bacterium]